MGQIADDILSGFQCETCGTCFKGEHGHPVVCESCWDDLNDVEQQQHTRAYIPEIGNEDVDDELMGVT